MKNDGDGNTEIIDACKFAPYDNLNFKASNRLHISQNHTTNGSDITSSTEEQCDIIIIQLAVAQLQSHGSYILKGCHVKSQ